MCGQSHRVRQQVKERVKEKERKREQEMQKGSCRDMLYEERGQPTFN